MSVCASSACRRTLTACRISRTLPSRKCWPARAEAMDSVPVSGMLLERLQGLGLDVERVLRLASVPRSRFSGVKTRVTPAEFFALWHAIELVAGDRELGLRLGSSSAP